MAASLAAAIRKEHDVQVELIRGGGGIFDVKVDGKLIYSKHQAGRFPEHHEVLAELDVIAT
jgi:selenoprotein W-related protein